MNPAPPCRLGTRRHISPFIFHPSTLSDSAYRHKLKPSCFGKAGQKRGGEIPNSHAQFLGAVRFRLPGGGCDRATTEQAAALPFSENSVPGDFGSQLPSIG